MIKTFKKRQLLDQCGFTADETKIILDYQKKLPILLEDNDTWINAPIVTGKQCIRSSV